LGILSIGILHKLSAQILGKVLKKQKTARGARARAVQAIADAL
jgi:hypothetical protein